MRRVFWLLLLLASAAIAATGADDHLLAGARAFREGRFAEALVEFQVAQKLGSADGASYAGASLQKLGHPREALETFAAGGPPGRDALLDYYRAMACYDARLYLCADSLLASVGDRSGARIGQLARETRARIAEALKPPPHKAAIDWYLQQAGEAESAGRPALARAYLEEVRGLAKRRADHYGDAQAQGGLKRLAGGKP